MESALTQGFAQAFQPGNLFASGIGVLLGLIVGTLPGLTISSGIVLLLPFTFFMTPERAMSLLLGLYAAGMTGGSISAILLDIPGTPSASATGLDGHAFTRRGEPGKALGTAIIASFCGGMVSLLCLVIIAPQLAHFALRFGAPELFALVFFGLTSICSFAERDLLKGLISAVLGLIFVTVGQDPVMGTRRYTFGWVELQAGVSFLPAMIGLFAIPQVLLGLQQRGKGHGLSGALPRISGLLPRWREIRGLGKTIGLGAVLGTGIGIIPGAAGPIAAFLSYEYARRLSRYPERFGTGLLEGVAAPEAANNGVTGGAMIPMLTLGIPGDPVTAILIGALLFHGLSPGPLLFQEHAPFVYTVFAAFLVANLFNLAIALLSVRFIVRVLQIPRESLLPIIALLCVVGTYALRNSFFDVSTMLFFGVLGFLMRRYGFPVVPMLLALVLGPLLEEHLRVALTLSQGDPLILITRPISLAFLLLALASVLGALFRGRARRTVDRRPSLD